MDEAPLHRLGPYPQKMVNTKSTSYLCEKSTTDLKMVDEPIRLQMVTVKHRVSMGVRFAARYTSFTFRFCNI